MGMNPSHSELVRGRRSRVAFVGIQALLVALCFCGGAFAQETAVDYLEPRITRAQFTVFAQRLDLRKDQRTIAELSFSDYNTTFTNLAKSLDEQAIGAGRRTVQDALAGKARVAPDELRRLRVEVLKVYQQAWPQLDEALTNLVDTIETLLTNEQIAQFELALRQLHREILLHPRQSDSDYQEYAGDGVDVLLLAQSGLAEGGELAALGTEPLQPALEAYELQLDDLLIQTAPEDRRGKIMRQIAAIEKNSELRAEQQKASLERWKQLYELNLATVVQIGEIAATIDDAARQRWLDRFDQASFTWLYPRKKPDRQIEWIVKQSLSDEKLQQANAIYDDYVQERKALSRRAIQLMLRGRLEFQTMLYSMMDAEPIKDDRVRRGLYEELLKNTGEQADLESDTSAALEGLLSDSQRQALRDAMKKPDSARRR